MINHSISKQSDLVPVLVCEGCDEIVNDLDYAEVVWSDVVPNKPIQTMFGHTHCTSRFDEGFPNNMNAKEYLEKLI